MCWEISDSLTLLLDPYESHRDVSIIFLESYNSQEKQNYPADFFKINFLTEESKNVWISLSINISQKRELQIKLQAGTGYVEDELLFSALTFTFRS